MGWLLLFATLRQGRRRPILREKLMDFRLVVFYGH